MPGAALPGAAAGGGIEGAGAGAGVLLIGGGGAEGADGLLLDCAYTAEATAMDNELAARKPSARCFFILISCLRPHIGQTRSSKRCAALRANDVVAAAFRRARARRLLAPYAAA